MFIKKAYKVMINIHKYHVKSTPAEDLANKRPTDPAGSKDHYFIHYG